MKHYWNDEKKKYGFYLVGFFPKGKMCKYCINPLNDKPFEINNIEGSVSGKWFKGMPNMVANEWFFFEGNKIKDIESNQYVRDVINDLWKEWCNKYKRKYLPLYKKLTHNTGKVNKK